MKITVFFSNDLSFVYRLNDTETATKWAAMMQKVSVANMSRQEENHRHGFASKDDIRRNIAQLTELCERIGMPKVDLSANHWIDWQKNLNIAHVAFPSMVTSGKHFKAAHTCNLLIHWLEYELANLFDDAEQYLFNLDFNHQADVYNMIQPIPRRELEYFTTDIQFGTLNLHYIHIGRHFFEMYLANDQVCLQEHFKPQWHFNATCAVNFSEAHDQSGLPQKMKQYYDSRGGETFFRIPFDDPTMAKGFFKLGELENCAQYTESDRAAIREQLTTAVVTGWEVHSN